MDIQNLTLFVTENCNFDCGYCYQNKSQNYMTFATARKALAFFLPFLNDNYNINFYGGEPLLCFDLIEKILLFLEQKNKEYNKKPRYSLTTNGSLITEKILKTLDAHKFSVVFSFDGYAQDIHRKKGSFEQAVSNIKNILEHPNIRLEVNSVFTPETVVHISDSMAFIMNLGIENINLSLSLIHPWNDTALGQLKKEMINLRKSLLVHYKKTKKIPVKSFLKEDSVEYYYCPGGQSGMAVTPDGHVWGCDLFADYLRGKENLPEYHDYFFGDLDTFAKNHGKIYPKISSNYAKLSMDNFATPHKECLICLNLEECSVCPMVAALSGASIGKIPAYICAIQKIKIAERQKFQKEIMG